VLTTAIHPALSLGNRNFLSLADNAIQ
jgi:hypothetical protein